MTPISMSIAKQFVLAATLAILGTAVVAKLPAAPPVDPKVAEEKAAKDKASAEKVKVLQGAAEERAVKNFQSNMKKAGKPVPKPTPIVAAQAPAPAAAAKGAAEKAKDKPAKKQ